jgi:hypothetical protein
MSQLKRGAKSRVMYIPPGRSPAARCGGSKPSPETFLMRRFGSRHLVTAQGWASVGKTSRAFAIKHLM